MVLYAAKTITTNIPKWYHVVISADLTDINKFHFTIDGVDQNVVPATYINDNIDFTTSNYYVNKRAN